MNNWTCVLLLCWRGAQLPGPLFFPSVLHIRPILHHHHHQLHTIIHGNNDIIATNIIIIGKTEEMFSFGPDIPMPKFAALFMKSWLCMFLVIFSRTSFIRWFGQCQKEICLLLYSLIYFNKLGSGEQGVYCLDIWRGGGNLFSSRPKTETIKQRETLWLFCKAEQPDKWFPLYTLPMILCSSLHWTHCYPLTENRVQIECCSRIVFWEYR